MAIGEVHIFALVEQDGKNKVYGWGSNVFGQLFANNEDVVNQPKDFTDQFELPEGEHVQKIEAGGQHSLFLTNQNRVFGIGKANKG